MLPLILRSVVALTLAAPGEASQPAPLSVYTYSRDSDAGFKDELLDAFRRELGGHLESFARVAYSKSEAQVKVELLGQGELTVEIEDDAPVRYLFRADESASNMWALVRVGRFSKEFSIQGSGARDLSRLGKIIADWLRTNAGAIRER